jgi:hypothetical protein
MSRRRIVGVNNMETLRLAGDESSYEAAEQFQPSFIDFYSSESVV